MEDKMSILQELQVQRTDAVSKLERIEEKKSTVSVEVYEKVKKEYAEKLKGIEEQLSGHIDLITDEIQRLKNLEEEIIQKEKELKFDMEEVELRYSIGEYDENSFKKAKDDHDGNMKQFDQELEKTRETMSYYSSFLTSKEAKPEPKPEEKPAESAKPESELKIDEHILEEKLPEEEIALEELLSEEEAVKPDITEEGTTQPDAEKNKGVKCSKCGHINTADSWYCEKCGAEILGASGSS